MEDGGDGIEVGDEGGERLPVPPDSFARIDPETNQITAWIEADVGNGQCCTPVVTVGEGTVWAIDVFGGSVLRQLDPQTNSVRGTVEIVGEATNIAIGEGSVWVTSDLAGEGVLVEIDAGTGRFRRAVGLGYSDLTAVAVGAGAVWVAAAGADGNVALRINPTTGEVVAAIALSDQPREVAVGEGAIWLVSGDESEDSGPSTLWRIDPATNLVVATIELPGDASGFPSIAVGAGGVWVTDWAAEGGDATLFRIDPATNRITASIPVEQGPFGVAVGRGSVWVVHHPQGLVSRIDPARNQVIETIDIEGVACGCSIAVGAGGVWAS